MHHMTKKKLVAEFLPKAQAGATAVEIKNSITQANPDLLLEEVDEIVFAVFEEPEKEQPKKETPVNDDPNSSIRGKKLYDIFRGSWYPVEVVTGFDGKDLVVKWEFRKIGKAIKTGIPCEPAKADFFNQGKYLRVGKVETEQMFEQGSEEARFDTLPNPNERRKVNA